MHAEVLRAFFEGRTTGEELTLDLAGTTVRRAFDEYEHRMTDLDEDFEVTIDHLVRLCDTVLAGELDPNHLEEIGFGMIVSSHFNWDTGTLEGEWIGDTLQDWASPEINYALNSSTVAKFRVRLLTGESTFTRDDFGPSSPKR